MYGLTKILDYTSERGIIEDRTGRNTLTASNISIQKIGKIYSAYFNGTNANILIPYNSIFNTNFYVMNIWVKFNNFKITQAIIERPYTNSYIPPYEYFRISNNATNSKLIAASSGNNVGVTSSSFDTKFDNVIFICNGIKAYVYLNGILISTYNQYIFSSFPNNTNIYLGYRVNLSIYFKGYIPKVQIFNGTPSNPDLFAAQLFSSQKNMFGL